MAISGPTPHRPHPPLHARLAAAAVVGLLALGSAACSADDPADPAASAAAEPAPAQQGDGPRLVQGGESGEAAQEVPSDTTVAPNAWSQDDATFMSMMIPHHAQALEMTALADERAADPRVRRLAERISAAQGPEVQMMAAWLDERDLEVPSTAHGGHEGHAMAGMLSEEQMADLADARGARFDRLFLTSMIRHHEGALQMAGDTAGGGLDVLVNEYRDGLTSDQGTEIARMQQLLDALAS